MNSARKQRLIWVTALLVGVAVAVGLVLHALKNNIDLYLTPSQVIKRHISDKQTIRLGGMVLKGSVHRFTGLNITFDLTDFYDKVTVHYDGVLPSLFRVGQGIIAEGHMNDKGVFMAAQVLAKHDADYHPPEIPKNAKYK